MRSRHVLDAILFSISEYAALTGPIALYVLLEALNEKGLTFLLCSPEWGIATVFLVIHGPGLFEEEMKGGGLQLSEMRLRFIRNAGLGLAGLALLNSSLSFSHETTAKVVIRMTMFGLSSVGFVVWVGAAHHSLLRRKAQPVVAE